MKYYAHTKKDMPESEWHTLKDHLFETAETTSEFTHNDDFKKIFKLTGLLHDFGKYQDAFQKYLKEGGRRGSVPHAKWGAGYARKLGYNDISIAIDGHHKGLPDVADWKNDTVEYIKQELTSSSIDEQFSTVHSHFFHDLELPKSEFTCTKPNFSNKLEYELFIRYIFSSLTDADWLNTEKALNPESAGKRMYREFNHDELIRKLEEEIENKPKSGDLNNLRNTVREQALIKSSLPIGFYSLNLPTGMGKTLTSLLWALKHAKKNNLKRIIIVLPFINIIDQTANILKDIFGSELVLEHHSGNNEKIDVDEEADILTQTQRLACENWDYPIIITTTVQFFESLFSNRPSRCRKIHNIAESVVIFDEVQTLPKELVIPTLTMINNVSKIMNTSFMFCTATQPAFEKRDGFNGLEHIEPLIEYPDLIYKKTRRVTYHLINNTEPIKHDKLVDEIERQDRSILCIFNTKKPTLEFFKKISMMSSWDKVYHLSTSMCPHHRKKTIKSISKDLKDHQKICVSSTQLIEAGVDFDFPCVFREIAPLESIIQSAGRCNREWSNKEYGNVFIFRLEDSGMPDKIYKSSAESVLDMITENKDRLYDFDFFSEYYRTVLNLFVDPDRKKINEAREKFNFETISQCYRIIDKPNESMFIRSYNEESEKLCKEIEAKQFITREDFRRIQEYSVQVYTNFLFNNKTMYTESQPGFKVWYGRYDENTGITNDPFLAEDMVV